MIDAKIRTAPAGAKRTEWSRRKAVVMDAIRQAKVDATSRGQHDQATLLNVAGLSLTDEALTAIYSAVERDTRST